MLIVDQGTISFYVPHVHAMKLELVIPYISCAVCENWCPYEAPVSGDCCENWSQSAGLESSWSLINCEEHCGNDKPLCGQAEISFVFYECCPEV
jgi:hypothetical protein